MSPTTIRWARVEYQPDLRNPVSPIPLGIIVFAPLLDPNAFVVLGREPRKDHPPPELKGAGRLGFSQMTGWVGTVTRDIQDAQKQGADPLYALCSQWRWNLYVTDPESQAPQESDK